MWLLGLVSDREQGVTIQMGPCVKILLRNGLSNEQLRTMDSWLINNSKSFEGTPGDREVWIDQGTFSGCPDDVPCCISVMVQGHAPHAEPILYPDEVNAVLGYLPAQVIEISAGCNRRLDHYQVGHLALHFAQTYDGIIDMVGEITPPIPPNHEMYPWHNLEEIRAFVQGMPGMIWEVFLDQETNHPVLDHLVDTAFLEAWLRHPHFHMIK